MHDLLQSLILGLLLGGVYGLLASGMTLIYGVMRVINLAQGAFLILSAFVTYSLWSGFKLDPLAAIVVTTPLMFAVGYVTYLLAVRHIADAPLASSVLLTFGLALMAEAVMGIVWGNTSHSVRPSYGDESFEALGFFLPKAQLFGGILAGGTLVALWAVLTRTWTGRAIRSSSINRDGARLVGINVARISAISFGLGVAAAGAGGSIVSVMYPFVPGSHVAWISRLLAIVVLGGLSSIGGALTGAILMAVTEVLTTTYISPQWATAVPYAVIFLVLLVRPQGLFGTTMREDLAGA